MKLFKITKTLLSVSTFIAIVFIYDQLVFLFLIDNCNNLKFFSNVYNKENGYGNLGIHCCWKLNIGEPQKCCLLCCLQSNTNRYNE